MAKDCASSSGGVRASKLCILLCLLVIVPSAPASQKSDLKRQIQFGAQMAKQGNWQEAIFRWRRALSLNPSSARVHNNLAVAYESIGDYAKAGTEYLAALADADVPGEVRENYELFKTFYTRYKEVAQSPDSPTLGDPKAPDAKP